LKILIAEDDPVSNRLLAASLVKGGHEVVATHNGVEAWGALKEENAPQLAILDWMMPGLEGLDICRRIRKEKTTASVYVIMLTSKASKEDMVKGLEAGADDFLTKPFDRNELRVRLQAGERIVALQRSLAERVRELEGAIVERKRAEEALRNLSLTDELTGLYNRRGFFTLAEHHFSSTRRTRQSSLLIYADMDGLKQNNDSFGHREGSLAISKIADILRQTFRDYDIIARLGGDEFAFLVAGVAEDGIENITSRLGEDIRLYNEKGQHKYVLSLSIGAVCLDHRSNSTVEDIIARADAAMYIQKRLKKERSTAEGAVATKINNPVPGLEVILTN
jgi:diguanylate cyclase (GGDEF)-like protein